MIGTNTAGAMPLIMPVYDSGATPTIVYWCPESRIVRPTDARIAAERAPPVVVGKHDDRMGARRDVVLRTEQPPDLRRGARAAGSSRRSRARP